ncbi:MAG TPA: hypothetical protein VFQ42_19145 [Mycobacterium sp.]|nr:hypothetical protein [Mycobacterium sp.]
MTTPDGDGVAVPAATPCPDCGASILWLTTERGARMPVDAEPDGERGNVIRQGDRCSVLGRTQAAGARAAGVALHVHHKLTCPHAARWARDQRASP